MIVAAAAATTKKQGWRQCFKVSPVPASPVLILIGEKKTHEKQAAKLLTPCWCWCPNYQTGSISSSTTTNYCRCRIHHRHDRQALPAQHPSHGLVLVGHDHGHPCPPCARQWPQLCQGRFHSRLQAADSQGTPPTRARQHHSADGLSNSYGPVESHDCVPHSPNAKADV